MKERSETPSYEAREHSPAFLRKATRLAEVGKKRGKGTRSLVRGIKERAASRKQERKSGR